MDIRSVLFLPLLLIAGLFLVAGMLLAPKVINTTPSLINELIVLGQAKEDVTPDNALVYLQISTIEKATSDALEKNNSVYTDIKEYVDGLIKDNNGISLATTSFSVDEKKKYDSELKEYVLIGYEAEQSLKFKVEDFNSKGNLLVESIDAMLKNKGVTISSLSFEVSDSQLDGVKSKLIPKAINNAWTKAKQLAEAGMFVLNPVPTKVNMQDPNYYSPYSAKYYGELNTAVAEGLTNYTPQEQTITVNVDVTYTYK